MGTRGWVIVHRTPLDILCCSMVPGYVGRGCTVSHGTHCGADWYYYITTALGAFGVHNVPTDICWLRMLDMCVQCNVLVPFGPDEAGCIRQVVAALQDVQGTVWVC